MKKTDTHFLSHLAHFFLELEMFQTKVVEKIKTHVLCSVTFFLIRYVHEIRWKNVLEQGTPQMTIWQMAHCMLDTQGYKHTLRLCNAHCFSTATMVRRTHLNITLYVLCMCCLI